MPSPGAPLIEVQCPCCDTKLFIDPKHEVVIRHEEPARKPVIEDLAAAAQKLKGEAARREDAFQKSMQQHKAAPDILNRKFDELLKNAKQNPDAPGPKKPFDFD